MSEKKSSEHILIVDDQASVRAALRAGLEVESFKVSEARNMDEIMTCLDGQPPVDLITLDLMLEHEDGLVLAREIRTRRNVPIIMITARVEPIDRVKGLEHGADDYIVKPFHIREVLLRVQAVLRRYHPEAAAAELVDGAGAAGEVYACEAGTIDVKRRELHCEPGRKLQLTDAEFDIFVAFLRNPARVMSRDDLSMLLKGRPWSPQDRTLDGHVARLRKKIEPDLAEPRLIKTVWRVGYVFTGDVSRVS